MNNILNEVVVVEGYHDLATLKMIFPNIDIVITNGSEISGETLEELKVLNQKRGLVLFLDPDFQGERIRRIINDYVGNTKHAFLKKEDCISKNGKKVGIEHASKEKILEAFENIKWANKDDQPEQTQLGMNDLMQFGLIGDKHSKLFRKELCNHFGIGLSNGKTLLHKLNMFRISKTEISSWLGRD